MNFFLKKFKSIGFFCFLNRVIDKGGKNVMKKHIKRAIDMFVPTKEQSIKMWLKIKTIFNREDKEN